MRRVGVVPRFGFTLIELLVVIAIIGVLVGLTMPAVQAAREASRRSQCLNNLKQHGLALHAYVAASDAFPIGYLAWPSGGASPGWGWSAALLPQLEQGPVFDAININLPIDLPANATARAATLAIYVCPSDLRTGAFRVDSTLAGGPVEARTTSYAANQGSDGPAMGNGLFLPNKSIRPRDVRDGLSVTIAAGERGSFAVQNAWAGALADGRGGVQVLATVSGRVPDPSRPSPGTFAGPHPGQVQLLMADGSARPIKATIDPNVYRALATRSGREVVDQGAY